jgi:hypothetical protein
VNLRAITHLGPLPTQAKELGDFFGRFPQRWTGRTSSGCSPAFLGLPSHVLARQGMITGWSAAAVELIGAGVTTPGGDHQVVATGRHHVRDMAFLEPKPQVANLP